MSAFKTMITTYIITLFLYLIGVFFKLLPSVSSLPEIVDTTLANAMSYIVPFNVLLPLDTLLTAILFILAFEVSFLTFKIIVFVYKRARS